MGANRDDLLAEYYLKAAGVAAVWIDRDGLIGSQDAARLHLEEGRVAYCCPRGANFVLAYRLQLWKEDNEHVSAPRQAAIAARLEELADEGGVGITPHSIAIGRGRAAVAEVNARLAAMKAKGELRELNHSFKSARAVDPSLRYAEFLEAKKAALLEALARANAISR
ncbi:hypothetical protein SAMN05216330_102442 [Bradyrhizobium sp. Ghvi]|uniref:hypothetical protein n=1 Tax=Bradyrhizobium sp. Ghvi TaxID=1855319 RepID=UPI0008E59160|nr:hypothetical protein [Bradyrhizobium sp. Ghvi]SFO25953.1 hypothetical protein SAMN05216330_102442 [Bradyrhizobium sp. Ghvi]